MRVSCAVPAALMCAAVLLSGVSAPAPGGALSEADFQRLSREVVRLYGEMSALAERTGMKEADRAKRRREINRRVSLLIARIFQGGRNFYRSEAYRQWRSRRSAEGRRRRLARLRRRLKVTDEDEWAVLAPRIDRVLKAREALEEARSRTLADSPPELLARLRKETAQPDPDRRRMKALVDAVRAEHAAARAEAARLRALLDRAQDDLAGILTVQQEALLLLEGVID